MGLPMGYVRSGTKDHGRQNQIEGRLEKGQKVVVVEDLISAGRSTEIYNVLGLDKLDCTVAMIQNADSKREHLTLRRVWWTSSTATIRAASPPPNRSCTMSSGWWTARGSATAASTARAKRRCISNKTAGKSPQHIQSKRVRRGPMAAPY